MPQTVLITGASSGLGRATARLFHAHGWNVVATMRSPDRETELTQMERMVVAGLDVQDVATIGRAVAECIAAFGRIDVLVNNAGYGAYGPLESTPPYAAFSEAGYAQWKSRIWALEPARTRPRINSGRARSPIADEVRRFPDCAGAAPPAPARRARAVDRACRARRAPPAEARRSTFRRCSRLSAG